MKPFRSCIATVLVTAICIPVFAWSSSVHVAMGEALGMENPRDLTYPDKHRDYPHWVNDPGDFNEFYEGLIEQDENTIIHIITDLAAPLHCTRYDDWNRSNHKSMDHIIDDLSADEIMTKLIGDGTLKGSLYSLYLKSHEIARDMRSGKQFTREMAVEQLCHALFVIMVYDENKSNMVK